MLLLDSELCGGSQLTKSVRARRSPAVRGAHSRCPHPFPAARASCCSASTQDAHASGPCPRLSSHPDYSALSGHVANPSVPPGLYQVSFHPLPQPALPVPQPCLLLPSTDHSRTFLTLYAFVEGISCPTPNKRVRSLSAGRFVWAVRCVIFGA